MCSDLIQYGATCRVIKAQVHASSVSAVRRRKLRSYGVNSLPLRSSAVNMQLPSLFHSFINSPVFFAPRGLSSAICYNYSGCLLTKYTNMSA
jgi:hypothetical protein